MMTTLGTPVNNEAEELAQIQRSAEQGDAHAQYELGIRYIDGNGVPKDYAKAVNWLQKGAAQGDKDAQNRLGFLYGAGLGVPLNHAEAMKWFRKAAEQGQEFALYNIGWMYAEGLGVAQNHVEAAKWMRKAAELGHEESGKWLVEHGYSDKKEQDIERENLDRWIASGAPRRWVAEHGGTWGHNDWLNLVEELRGSGYWPMNLDAVGAALEKCKAAPQNRPQTETINTALSTDCQPLLDAARPDIYRQNAFRVTGLSIDATERDISRQAEKLRMMEKFSGGARQAGGFLPLNHSPDQDAVRDALQRLRDPEQRLVDEFFWFWPHQLGQSKTDEALVALGQGNATEAAGIWTRQEASLSESNVSMHNLAVLSHVAALDLEHAALTAPLTEEQKKQRDTCWQETFKRWQVLLAHEAFWSRLTARIREMGDPRLTTGTARRMRNALPLSLLSINARLARNAAELGDMAEAGRHMQLMHDAGFDQKVADEALKQAAKPVRERIKTLCQTAQSEAGADPVHADKAAGRLLDQTSPLLAVLDCLLPLAHLMRDGAHDEVAQQVLSCLISYGKKTENWKVTLKLLERALPIAATKSIAEEIRKNIETVKSNVQSASDWCGEGYYDLPEPVLAIMEKARELAKADRWDEAIPLLVELLMGRAEVQVEASAKHLIRKTLAVCLNLKAVDRLSKAVEKSNQPLSIMEKIRRRDESLRRSITLPRIPLIINGSLVESLECMACGRVITGNYMKYTINNSSLSICISCSNETEQEQTERKSEIKSAVTEQGEQLQLAAELDQENKTVKENLAAVKKMATDLGVTMQDSMQLRIRLGLASASELAAAARHGSDTARAAAKDALEKTYPDLAQQVAAKQRKRKVLQFAIAVVIMVCAVVGYQFNAFRAGDPSATYMLYRVGVVDKGKAVSVFMAALKDNNYRVVLDAASSLEKTDPDWVTSKEADEAIPVLMAALDDGDYRVRRAASDALTKIGRSTKKVMRPLLEKLVDANPAGRQIAEQVLNKIDPDWPKFKEAIDAVPMLIEKLNDENDYEVRRVATETIGNIGPGAKETVPNLAKLLKDSDPDIVKAAADALGHIGPGAKDAIPDLVKLLKNSSPSLQEAAAKALGNITQKKETKRVGKINVHQNMEGVWEDIENHDRHTIQENGGTLTVSSVVAGDGEVYEIKSVQWKSGMLNWSCRIPSTGVIVNYTTQSVYGDILEVYWSNQENAGKEKFRRLK